MFKKKGEKVGVKGNCQNCCWLLVVDLLKQIKGWAAEVLQKV
jgi:hypothetical protein